MNLRRMARPRVFQRGVSIFESGAIRRIVRRGEHVQASIQGSYPDPYQVRLAADAEGITEASCTCPYDHGGLCKHLVALGLCMVRAPDRIEEQPPVEEQLAELPNEALAELVTHLVEREPALADVLDAWVAANQPAPTTATPPGARAGARPNAVDPARYRERVRILVHSLDRMRRSEAYWHVADVVEDVIQVGREAQGFLDARRPADALVVLDAVTGAYHEEWLVLDGSDGSPPGVFHELGPLWTQALLEVQLDDQLDNPPDSPLEGQPDDQPDDQTRHRSLPEIAANLEMWVDELLEYGVWGALEAALIAAREGWSALEGHREEAAEDLRACVGHAETPSYEQLVQRARAEARDHGYAAFVDAALDVLEGRGRYAEALELAQVHGRPNRTAATLAAMGDPAAALAHAREQVHDPGQILPVAQALHRQGQPGPALELGAHGLALEGASDDRAELAGWVEQLARNEGAEEVALEALKVGFQIEPTIRRFEALGELAGDAASAIQQELLDELESASDLDPFARVELLLHAGRVEAAIEVVRGKDHYALIEPVAEAAMDVDPRWVVQASLAQAESIIENGWSKQYHHAVDWLDKARRGWVALGDEAAWRAYLEDLRDQHWRKYKLMGLLEKRFGLRPKA